MVDFVANYQAFGIGGLREVLGRSQPGTVGLLRREQPSRQAKVTFPESVLTVISILPIFIDELLISTRKASS